MLCRSDKFLLMLRVVGGLTSNPWRTNPATKSSKWISARRFWFTSESVFCLLFASSSRSSIHRLLSWLGIGDGQLARPRNVCHFARLGANGSSCRHGDVSQNPSALSSLMIPWILFILFFFFFYFAVCYICYFQQFQTSQRWQVIIFFLGVVRTGKKRLRDLYNSSFWLRLEPRVWLSVHIKASPIKTERCNSQLQNHTHTHARREENYMKVLLDVKACIKSNGHYRGSKHSIKLSHRTRTFQFPVLLNLANCMSSRVRLQVTIRSPTSEFRERKKRPFLIITWKLFHWKWCLHDICSHVCEYDLGISIMSAHCIQNS